MHSDKRIGVVLCACGPNIAGVVDLAHLKTALSGWPQVAWVEQDNLPCSEKGLQKVLAWLKERPVDALVVAGCSPKEREEPFRKAFKILGLNPFQVLMTNLREHCAWVESDPVQATRKAETILAAALARVRKHENIEERSIPARPEVLVVGAGPAGITAALHLAEAGRTVHLVEKTAAVGGRPALLDELYPKLECSSCAVEHMMDEVLHHPGIQVHLLSEVTSALGYAGNWKITLATADRGVSVEQCIGCGACVEACPVSAPDELMLLRSERHAMHQAYPGALPNAPLVDWSLCLRAREGECQACLDACGFNAVELKGSASATSFEVGTIVLATGSGGTSGGARRLFTAFEFERLSNPSGPTSGAITIGDGDVPKTIAVVADETADPLALINASKYTWLAVHRVPEARVHLFLQEFPGPGRERELVREALATGRAEFHRLEKGAVEVENEAGVEIRNGAECGVYDLAVHCASQEPGADNEALSRLFGVKLSADGRMTTPNPMMQPVAAHARGVYIAGAAAGAATLRESIAFGAAAAAGVLALYPPGSDLKLEPCVSVVNPVLCSGCRTCLQICPYGAIARTPEGVAFVEASLCRGCGLCSAGCPAGALKTLHFTLEQVLAEVNGATQGGRA
jgi:heterodisulfide reductase subunit A